MSTHLQQLHAAAYRGDADAVHTLLDHLEAVYGRNSGINFPLWGNTTIQYAAASGNIETVRLLLEHGATNINTAFWTAVQGDHVDLVQFLLDGYVSLDDAKLNPEHRTLLESAAEYGCPKLVAFALERDGLMLPEEELSSALFYAVCQENVEAVRILIEPVQQRVTGWRELFDVLATCSEIDTDAGAVSLLQGILMAS